MRPYLVFFISVLIVASHSVMMSEGQELVKPAYTLAIKDSYLVAWNPKGDVLAVGANDAIYLLDDHLELIQTLSNPVLLITGLSWSPDGRYVAASSRDAKFVNVVRVWDIQTGKLLNVFKGHKYIISSLAWSPDGRNIATGSEDQTLKVWDPFTGAVFHTFSYHPDDVTRAVYHVAWSPDGSRIAANIGYSGILIWDVATGDLKLHIPDNEIYEPITKDVAWSPDGKYFFDGYRLLDATTGEVIRGFICLYSDVVAWHPQSVYMAAYGVYLPDKDRTLLMVCNMLTNTVVAQLDSGSNFNEAGTYVNALSWNPDGKRLASAAGDGFVRIWDVPLPPP